MATGGLYGSSTANVSVSSGAESNGLYGNNTNFGGTYFEWFVFQEAASQPSTPTGGSWSFVTNTGTPPTGWTLQPPTAPTNQVWVSIALVNSRSTAALTWSTPGLFGVVPAFTFPTPVTGAPGSNAAVVNTGTATNPILTFTIPRGDVGATGPTGATGPQGPKGDTGATGAGVATGGTTGQVLTKVSGTNYDTNWTTPTTGTVTSVAATAGTGISVTGSPITSSGTLNITNTAPDQTVVLTAGTGISTSGTYPNFTITNTSPSSGGTVTSVTGTAPVVSSGGNTPAISLTTSGANSVVVRDSNQNITTNCLFEGYTTQAASGTTITLTASTAQNYQITGSGGQTIKLPDATTLPNGALFTFNNNQSSGAITVVNNSSTTIATIQSGGYVTVVLLSNSIAAGSWDRHDSTPSNVSWSTNTLDYAGSITSATWNGTAVAINRGGTGASTKATAFNALSPMSAAGDVIYGGTSGAGTALAIGTAGQVLTVNSGATAPQWSTPTTGTVTSVGGTGTVNGITLTGTVTSSGNLTLGGTLGSIANSQLTNSAITFGSTSQALGSTVSGISGVTIDNGAVGATTPSTGTFTTLTAQTEVLKGTGENLLLQSQTFNTSPWTGAALTINQTATTAPDSTSTGNGIVPTTASAVHRIYQFLSFVSGVTYTISIYAKANGYNYLFINAGTAFNASTTFNISTGAITTTGGGTATITSAGNGWYRCTVTGTATSTASPAAFIQVNSTQTGATDDTFTGDGTSGIYLWGAQLELGSTVNTYKVTTTTAIYGTPSLSFSGVAGLGLQSDGSLYVSPAGTGAIQAQATTSSATGGNARGANAVDWQTIRDAASKVASGAYSVVTGGYGNQSTGQYAINLGGAFNNSNSTYTGIYGGTNNTASLPFATVVNGSANTAAGYFNFIGAGFTNSGTSSSAVTTQSGTMNATTAVTLSGSNASIKVGQYITGTSIAGDTYVAAISGTALTLSKNASGSSTSTLSFYTPHGVVVGGGNNQATGSYSFIGGGGDAGTAGNRNVASGDWSTVAGGFKNTASGLASFIGGGGLYSGTSSAQPNQATNSASVVVGGLNNTSSGFSAFIGAGNSNLANSQYSFISGGAYGTTRGIVGYHVFPAHSVPISFSNGVSQAAILVLGVQTTDATATVLRSDTNAASGTNQVILPNNSAYYFRGEVVAGVTGAGDTKGWSIEGVIKRGAGVATAALVGTPTVTSLYADTGATTWTVTALADTTNGGLKITVTGQASTTIRWVCSIRTAEMTF